MDNNENLTKELVMILSLIDCTSLCRKIRNWREIQEMVTKVCTNKSEHTGREKSLWAKLC